MTIPRRAVLGFALAGAVAVVGPAAGQTQRVLAVATGDVAGAYFPAAVALCRVVNEGRREHGLRCAATPSGGSVDNLGRLRSGEVAFAIVQSDTQDAARRGTGAFAGAPFPELRAVMALFPEPLALVARAGAGVAGLDDLVGRRVSVGPAGSGQRALIGALMSRLGWESAAFAAMLELEPSLAVIELCEGRIDAFFYAVGQPAAAIREAAAGCGATLVDVAGPAPDAVAAGNPHVVAIEIPPGLYAGIDRPVRSIGPSATLVTRADLPEGEIEIVAGSILDALPDLGGFDPALAALDPEAMAGAGATAPLHPGAEAAFRARGLLD